VKTGLAVLLIALTAAVLLIAGQLSLSGQSLSPANPSWDGLSSLAAGANVRPLYSFDHLGGGTTGDTLLVIGPSTGFSSTEAGQVSDFLRLGGRLVIMDDYGTGNDLLAWLGSPVTINRSPLCQGVDYYKRASFPIIRSMADEGLTANVGSLLLNHPTSLQVSGTAQVLANTTDKAWLDKNDDARLNGGETFGTYPVMARFGYGKGEVIVLSDADPLNNGMLDKNGNSGLLTNLVRSGTVYVDTAHGQQVPILASLYFAIKGSLAVQAVIALIVILMAYLAVARVRIFARLRPRVKPPGPSMSGKERLLALETPAFDRPGNARAKQKIVGRTMTTDVSMQLSMETFQSQALQVVKSVKKAIIGKDELIVDLLIALLAEGNVLIEGVPGVAKTSIAKAFASALNMDFKRIQFVPDILPGDIIGMSVYNQKTGLFEIRGGPIFTNILLVDEINRASPKIQSALLEAMEEKQVSIDGNTYLLSFPFMVITTQNPIDIAGTFPLPEAQIDRFMFKLNVGYLDPGEELSLLQFKRDAPVADADPGAIGSEDIIRLIETVRQVRVDDRILEYIRDLVVASRTNEKLLLGASHRASIALLRASRAVAMISGRDYVLPDDVKYLVPKVLSHRLIVKPELELEGVTSYMIIKELLDTVAVPV
jgi:MoxR-like ATPase